MIRREYSCQQCGTFEMKQSIKDEPFKVCPKCEKPIRRIYSIPSIRWAPEYDIETDEIITRRGWF